MNFCQKALENEVKSVAKLSNNIHILKPVLSCPVLKQRSIYVFGV